MSEPLVVALEARPRRFRPYPQYMDSGVEWLGEVPAHWHMAPLFTLARERDNRNVSGAETNVLSLSYGRIIRRDISDNFGLMPESFDTYQIVEPGNLVLRLTDLQNDKRSLRVGLVEERGIITSAYVSLEVVARVTPRFGFYLLHAYDVTKVFYTLGAGVRQTMKFEDLKWMPMLIPGRHEQQAIVAFLDRETSKIDALIEKKERLIALLQEKRAALITRAITKGFDPNVPMTDSGIEWLGEIPVHWGVFQLRRIIQRFVDYRGKTPEKSRSGIRLVTAKNIRNQMINFALSEEFIPEDLYDRWMVRGFPERGDVLITTEAPLGESAQIEDSGIALAQRIILLKSDATKMTNDYLKYYFASDCGRSELWSRGTGSTAVGIKASHLKAIAVPVPPTAEQRGITSHIDRETAASDAMIRKIRDAIRHLGEYRTALISTAVTGKIDVGEEAA